MEKPNEFSQRFTFRNPRLQRNTQKVEMISSSSNNSSNESSVSIDDETEIEIIKGKNKKINQKITAQIMNFKYSSRLLMNVDSSKEIPVSPFPECIYKNKKAQAEESNGDLSQTRTEKTENKRLAKLLHTVEKLKTQHRRARSELDQNLLQIIKVEEEKNSLKSELNDLQEKFFIENSSTRKSSCLIF